MTFFFVKDHKRDHRFFSSEPPKPVEIKRSKAKEAWELAKRKLMLLPQKTLRQEQAFYRALKIKDPAVRIHYSGFSDEHKIEHKFRFFLNKQRTKRIFYLIGEAIVLPFTALTMPLPGPNISFYVLALLMITHWQSFIGVRDILKKEHEFIAAPLLTEWENAVKAHDEAAFPDILGRIETKFGLTGLAKVLWK
ncbi:MAG: hypothetical protein NTU60_01655 [Candidatus Aminicenantes bacterium]|nr:hypothetical protein [Candidatus Aminicenantes bacterium]